tara:strand:+ start:563 stop:871 length:309 start_codon:yes stop_codon:yes gene_type:complete
MVPVLTVPSEPFSLKVIVVSLVASTIKSPLLEGVTEDAGVKTKAPTVRELRLSILDLALDQVHLLDALVSASVTINRSLSVIEVISVNSLNFAMFLVEVLSI